MTLFINSATYRILLAKIRSGDLNGFTAACSFADATIWEERDEQGRHLIHHAALAGNAKFIEEMTARGARTDVTDNDKQTPYSLAKSKSRKQAMAALAPPRPAAATTAEPAGESDAASVAITGPRTFRVTLKAGTFPGRPARA